jgi:recombination protein RecT
MNTAVAVIDKDKPPLVVLRERLKDRESEIKAALTDAGIKPEAFIRAIVTSAAINPDILGCTWQSLWIAIMRACRDGLMPDGIEGALVAYKSTANWLPMYQGMLRLFRRSGQFKWIAAEIVRTGEPFHYYIDERGAHFRHEPGEDFDAPMVKVYAAATTKDDAFFCAVLTKKEADKIRAMSRTTRDDAPWKSWPEQMYKKTAIKRLSKVLPSIRDVIGDDDDLVEVPPVELAPQRAAGPAAALTEFAAQSESVSTSATSPSAETSGKQGADEASAGDPAAAPLPDPLFIAWERGKQAKAAGMARRALPGEYRSQGRAQEGDAWVLGWDDKPFEPELLP